MTLSDIASYRLINQQIAETKFKKPPEIVGWLGAMQAQDFAMSKWAIGLRLPALNDTDVEKTFNDGGILRTHLLRPTWHFVTPADIRWMLALTAPRVNAANAFMYRKLELDNTIFKRSNDILVKTLQGGKQFTRSSLKVALERAKIAADGLRLGYLMMRAELDGIICSGPRQGKQFTYALLDERIPVEARTKSLHQDEALAELTRRYFTSRGPATLQDFVWWSGLTTKEAKAGIATLPHQFIHKVIDGQNYVYAPMESKNIRDLKTGRLQTTFLMPDYDEYGISYKNRSAISIKDISPETLGENAAYYHMVVIDGVMAGNWKRTIKNNTVTIITNFFILLSKQKHQAVRNAVKRYSSFVG